MKSLTVELDYEFVLVIDEIDPGDKPCPIACRPRIDVVLVLVRTNLVLRFPVRTNFGEA